MATTDALTHGMTGTTHGTTADGMAIAGIVLGDGTAAGTAGAVHITAGMATEDVLTPAIAEEAAIAADIPVLAAVGDVAMVALIAADLQAAGRLLTAVARAILHHV